jgi:hypothetical protein
MGAGLAPRGFEPSLVWRGAPGLDEEPPRAGRSSLLRDEFGPLGLRGESPEGLSERGRLSTISYASSSFMKLMCSFCIKVSNEFSLIHIFRSYFDVKNNFRIKNISSGK